MTRLGIECAVSRTDGEYSTIKLPAGSTSHGIDTKIVKLSL